MNYKKKIKFLFLPTMILPITILVSCGKKEEKKTIDKIEIKKIRKKWNTKDSFPKKNSPLFQKSTNNILEYFKKINGFEEKIFIDKNNGFKKGYKIKAVYIKKNNYAKKEIVYSLFIGNNEMIDSLDVTIKFESN